jgi:hypothetical protein
MIWSALTEVRNRLDHAGHQAGGWPLKTFQKKVDREIIPQLRDIAAQWGIA